MICDAPPSCCFNPRTHVGCDSTPWSLGSILTSFNPRTHVGCDKEAIANIRTFMFQSTHPRGVRRKDLETISRTASFNPRTHVGCDLRIHDGAEELGVSIHAPTWGATIRVMRPSRVAGVSIHAPTWGATHIQQISEYHITKVHLIANNMQIFEYLHESYGYRYLFV